MTAKPRRVALYLRVSTDGQSTALQRRDLVEACKHRGWEVTEVYEDDHDEYAAPAPAGPPRGTAGSVLASRDADDALTRGAFCTSVASRMPTSAASSARVICAAWSSARYSAGRRASAALARAASTRASTAAFGSMASESA